MSDRNSRSGKSSGKITASFSLVEMLVAMAIFSIITIVLLAMTFSLLKTWQFDQGKNERRTSGQAVLDRMTRDLRMASLPLSQTNIKNLQFVINPSGVSASYKYPQAVFWQAPVGTDGGTNGNIAIVGYFVQWISGVPCLSRVLINPSTVASFAIYSNPTSWMTTSLVNTTTPATPASGYQGLLAENVLGLWVQALDPRGNPIKQSTGIAGENFDSRLSYAYTNSVRTTTASTNQASVLPSSVQIAILIVDAQTGKRLRGSASEMPTLLTGNFWFDIQTFYNGLSAPIRKGAEIQTITVDLANGPR